MKKRILSLVLALSMMISLFPVSALAQAPGGGTAVLAEENGTTEGTTGSITINNNGVPVTDGLDIDSDGNYIGTNWKYNADGEGTLTLMSGTWNLANQNAVKCYVAIDEKATVAGGTFENTVWNEAGGKISGGTFKKTVSNKGTITGGIFVGVDSESTSVINYGTGKITGGVFKVLPSNGIDSEANQYRIEFADTANTDTLSVNDVDFGTGKVYVVGMDNETLNVRTKNTAISTINNTISVTHGHNYTNFVPSNVRLDEEKDGSTYLLKLNKMITKLEFSSYGFPIIVGRESIFINGQQGCKGDGWQYVSTLTLLSGKWDFSNEVPIACNVKVNNNGWASATIEGGVFTAWVANYGTIENGVYRHDVTNYNGTVKNGIFLGNVDISGAGQYKSIVQGGVFKNAPSPATGYTKHSITSYVSNRTIKVKIDGVSDFEDVGSSPVVVTKEGEGTTISVQLWESGTSGQATTIRSLNGKAIGPDNCNSSWDENTKTLTFTTPTTGNIELNGPLENAELEFVSNYSGGNVNLGSERITFDMPAENVTLTATYAKTPKYTLTVDGGYIGADKNQISGDYKAGATIKLTAEDAAEGKEFDKWVLHGLTLVDGCQETNATIEVTITGNATAKATYKDKAPTTYTLTVDGGYIGDDETKARGEFKAEAQIKVTAKAKTGYHFTKWTVEESTLSLSEEKLKANPLTFGMPDGAVSLKANYEKDTPDPVDPNPTPNPDDQPKTYTVTVKGGKINGETKVEGIAKGTKLTVDVDESEVPEGMTFDVWSIRFPEGVKDTLTGDPSVMLHDPHMSFAMPEADITIEAQYRSSELPGEDDGPSALGTMATVAVGGAAAGILVWQGVSLGVDSYLQLNLPKGVAVPANRRELVVLLWETAGKPEAALPSLYSDVPAEEIELQKATRWAIDNGLVKPADDNDASRFDPDRYVTKYDVFGAWLKLKKLMK